MAEYQATLEHQEIERELALLKRGTAEIITEEDLARKLLNAKKSRKPLIIKLGIDPTAPDVHLGFAVVLRKLRQFQELGHQVVIIIGDFTARIGDPSGRVETRPLLTPEEIEANAKTYIQQFGTILWFGRRQQQQQDDSTLRAEETRPHQVTDQTIDLEKDAALESGLNLFPESLLLPAKVVFNGSWLSPLTFEEIVKLSTHFTVAQILERDDFQKRFQGNKPIGLHEFLYPLMQGYDSVAIQADVELGGTDQKFNLLVGRELQREMGQEAQVAMMMPILEGLDGVQKMSKSLGNYIGIYEPPGEMYGKVMSIPDSVMFRYFLLATEMPEEEIKKKEEALRKGEAHPMDLKKELAREIVSLYHGGEAAAKAQEEFVRKFGGHQLSGQGDLEAKLTVASPLPVSVDRLQQNQGKIWVVDLLMHTAVVESKREARRLISQGGVSLNGQKLSNHEEFLEIHEGDLLQVGKRSFFKVTLEHG